WTCGSCSMRAAWFCGATPTLTTRNNWHSTRSWTRRTCPSGPMRSMCLERSVSHHAKCTMNATHKPIDTLTAGDVMNRALAVIPRQMLVRSAIGLIHRTRVGAAPVVDEDGRCVGMLTSADVFRWAEAGCPETVVGPARTCPGRQLHFPQATEGLQKALRQIRAV